MQDKNIVVVAAGLIMIIAIFIFVTSGYYTYATISLKANNTVNSSLSLQKDIVIKKLVKQLGSKQKELDSVKSELAALKGKINDIKTN